MINIWLKQNFREPGNIFHGHKESNQKLFHSLPKNWNIQFSCSFFLFYNNKLSIGTQKDCIWKLRLHIYQLANPRWRQMEPGTARPSWRILRTTTFKKFSDINVSCYTVFRSIDLLLARRSLSRSLFRYSGCVCVTALETALEIARNQSRVYLSKQSISDSQYMQLPHLSSDTPFLLSWKCIMTHGRYD